MNIHITLVPVLSIVAGLVILIVPRILNYVIALYLIVAGVVAMVPMPV
ncbi:MAG TPA: DUF3096 domain-containing protein [Nevskiaceae bacterium]|nr:DUF3096 domain-containing protein [Nevskiaceae bacterium]